LAGPDTSVQDLFTADFKPSRVYLLYGDENTGKTTLLLTAASKLMAKGRRVVWVDCGARLHPQRLKQLVEPAHLDMMYVAQPRTFKQQLTSITNIHDRPPADTKLVVCDDFTHLHRLELTGKPSQDLPVYEALAFQAALLKDLAIERSIPAVVVGLVHEIPALSITAPVAGRIVSYWSDCVVKLTRKNSLREAVEEKPGARARRFTITEKGLQALDR